MDKDRKLNTLLNNKYQDLAKENHLESELKIIRYMNFAKLISLLENKELFLTPADKFEDFYEGIFPDGYISIYKKDDPGKESITGDLDFNTIHEDIVNVKDKTYISSWNILEDESYAMWKIYGESQGVAIQSTFESLLDLSRTNNAVVRKVKYLDEDDVFWHVSHDNKPISMHDFFSIKKKFYNYENEIRMILINESKKRIAFKIDEIEDFISKVYVSPFAEEWFFKLVKEVIHERYCLNIDVIRSEIKVNR